MARIQVVTDSACDLSAELAAERNVTVVPLSIRFGSEEFVDGSTLSTDEFWARCAASPVLPETSAPSPVPFRAPSWPRPRTATTGSSASICPRSLGHLPVGGGCGKAVEDRIPVRTVDSRSLTMGLGLIVLDLADLAATGADLDDLAERVDRLIPRTRVFGALDTLEHLEKGGASVVRGPSSDRCSRSNRWSPLVRRPVSRRSRSNAPGSDRCATWRTRPAKRTDQPDRPSATEPQTTSTSSWPCSTRRRPSIRWWWPTSARSSVPTPVRAPSGCA